MARKNKNTNFSFISVLCKPVSIKLRKAYGTNKVTTAAKTNNENANSQCI